MLLFGKISSVAGNFEGGRVALACVRSNFRKTMILKNKLCQNAIEAANANLG